jgi:hypothetical protein
MTTPLFILTKKYARFLHTEVTVSTSTNQQKQEGKLNLACCLLSKGFLFGLLFDPEDGGDIFL